jgi:hypothetical protein
MRANVARVRMRLRASDAFACVNVLRDPKLHAITQTMQLGFVHVAKCDMHTPKLNVLRLWRECFVIVA